MRKKLKFSRGAIIPALCFLFALIVGVAAVVEKILFNTEYSVNTTKYVFLGYLAFFFVFIGIFIPVTRWFFSFLKIRNTNIFDGISTILIGLVSVVPMIILVFVTLSVIGLLSVSKKSIYYVYNWGISTAIILMGTMTRYHGNIKTSNKTGVRRIVVANHTGPWDYSGISQAMGTEPWNIVAGINLKRNTKTFGDWLISVTIGKVVEKYSISVDRDFESSKVISARGILSELGAGKNVAVFPEGGRIPKLTIQKGKILGDFKDGVFKIAYKNNIPIQPVVMDWPVIWRGKNDDRWGIRPCVVDIYFLDELYPENYSSFEELKQACWDVMHNQLASSKKVQRFISA